jgi:hypothetical protein
MDNFAYFRIFQYEDVRGNSAKRKAGNIERTADPADKLNHSDRPLLRLFKTYFTKDKQFLTAK